MNQHRTHYLITEWLSDSESSNLIINLYTMPLRDFEKQHIENGHACYELKKINPLPIIDFFEHLIVSWEPIENWGNFKYTKHETRVIDPNSSTERRVLERLILRTIEYAQPRNEITAKQGKFTWLKPERVVENIAIHRSISCDVTVSQEGKISVGFDLKHNFRTNETVLELIKSSSIQRGDRVVDKYNNIHYQFDGMSESTISDEIPELRQSLIDYYSNDHKQAWKVKKLDPNMPVIYVTSQNGKRFVYAPTMLHKELTFSSLPASVVKRTSDVYKQNAQEKLSILLENIQPILNRCNNIKFSKPKLLVPYNGYEILHVNAPSLSFGKSIIEKNLKYGLDKGGTVEAKPLSINLLVYPELINTRLKDITSFIDNLSSLSEKWGVSLSITKTSNSYRNSLIDFSNPHQLALLLKELANTTFQSLTLVITNNDISEMWYNIIKKEFGGNSSIPTQFVNIDTILRANDYVLGNILLGLYSKAGIQSWTLSSPLSSDCFIGLDVSHEEGRHSTGIVQIVGKDGRVFSSNANTSNEVGEKIRHETMCQIVYSAIDQYQKHYNFKPKHITFHRDGFCKEDLESLDEVMNSLDVSYDMVEIIKKTNRRIGISTNNGDWETKQGICYLKGDLAYLIATNPHSKIGTAQPIKIVKKKGTLTMQEIIQDVYHLSFMHVGSLLKCRLPITTYYADLSSTFFNRQWLPNDSNNSLHFV